MKISLSDVGVIAIYRHQCAVIKSTLLNAMGEQWAQEIEINTADKFQGREKNIIIVSFVWTGYPDESSKVSVSSSSSFAVTVLLDIYSIRTFVLQVSELLNDPRRINVALTRAKHKLILIGAITPLKQYDSLRKLLSLIDSNQLIALDEQSIL